jgi:hypothetical protein
VGRYLDLIRLAKEAPIAPRDPFSGEGIDGLPAIPAKCEISEKSEQSGSRNSRERPIKNTPPKIDVEPCRCCGTDGHWVNRFGMVICSRCHPNPLALDLDPIDLLVRYALAVLQAPIVHGPLPPLPTPARSRDVHEARAQAITLLDLGPPSRRRPKAESSRLRVHRVDMSGLPGLPVHAAQGSGPARAGRIALHRARTPFAPCCSDGTGQVPDRGCRRRGGQCRYSVLNADGGSSCHACVIIWGRWRDDPLGGIRADSSRDRRFSRGGATTRRLAGSSWTNGIVKTNRPARYWIEVDGVVHEIHHGAV